MRDTPRAAAHQHPLSSAAPIRAPRAVCPIRRPPARCYSRWSPAWEVGLRGKPEIPFLHNLSWNVGAFRAENHNDILFIAAPQTGTGYFQNFAKTLREGFDADLNGRIARVTWGLDWTFLPATYQSTESLDGSANNTNNLALLGYPGLDGVITVQPGDRIPLIPKQTGKAYAEFQATAKLLFDLNEVVVSSSYARGNENNAYKADGVYYLGPGVSPGYATGPEAGNAPAQSATFFAPGAPRRAWVELGVKF